MAETRKNGWVIVILLALACLANAGILKYRDPEAQAAPDLESLPLQVGEWTSPGEMAMPQYVLDVLRPDAYVSRAYNDGAGNSIYLFAQFHGTNRWGAHQPEVCFTSQGWSIEYENLASTVEAELPGTGVSANRFLAQKGNHTQIVLYWWFSSNNFQTASRTAQMLDSLKLQIIGGKGGGNGFIEVSSSLTPGSERETEERLRRFAADLVPLFGEIVVSRERPPS